MPPLPQMTRPDPDTSNPPQYMTQPEKARVRLAGMRVVRRYPGPVGAVLARELFGWEQFGWRLAHDGLINQLVDHILDDDTEDAA